MSITLITGPMFAGKTSRMYIEFMNKTYNKKGKIFKWSSDIRFSDKPLIVTHSDIRFDAIKVEFFDELLEYINDIDVFAIDEVQFLKVRDGQGVREVIGTLRDNNKDIIVAGLDADYKERPWPIISELFAMKDKIIPLTAQCESCYECLCMHIPATKSYLKGHKKDSPDDMIVTSSYTDFRPLCTACYKSMYL